MKNKEEKKLIEKLIHRKQLTLDNMNYSLHRLDLLIISISGAGVYTCLEFSKFMLEKDKEISSAIQISTLLFVLSIVLNLISQYTGYLSNRYDYAMCEEKINCNDDNDEINSKIESLDKKSQRFDDITSFLNITSLCLLILGLIFLCVYFFNITF